MGQYSVTHAMVHGGISHGSDIGGTRLADIIMLYHGIIYGNHCRRFSCSVMLGLGSRAPIVIKWAAVVLVIWPHFNGNAQRRPRQFGIGAVFFADMLVSMHKPRASKRKIKSAEELPKALWPDSVLFGRPPWACRLACLPSGDNPHAKGPWGARGRLLVTKRWP